MGRRYPTGAKPQEVTQMSEASFPVEVVSGIPVVAAPEEVDMNNAARLRAAALEAATRGNGTLVVDMSRTQFCDSSGIGVLVRAYQQADAEGGEVLLVVVGAAVLRILAIIGIDHLIPIFSSLGEALARAAVPGSAGLGASPVLQADPEPLSTPS
jgi:anti-sigma B factor antagonist